MADSRCADSTEDQELLKWAQTKTFICRVYLLFALSIATAAGACILGITSLKIGLGTPYLLVVAFQFIALFFVIWVRKIPVLNLLGLFTFTGASGLSLAPFVGYLIHSGYGGLIILALGLTLLLFVSLSAYVLLTRYDFTFMGGMLFKSLLVMIVMLLVNRLFVCSSFTIFGALLACAGALLFSGYVIYDTSSMIHTHEPDDYIEATINLYLDFLNLFVDFLRILLELSRDIDFPDITGIFDFLDF
jgi:modulator of FtsH protease